MGDPTIEQARQDLLRGGWMVLTGLTVSLIQSKPGYARLCGGNWPELSLGSWRWKHASFAWTWFGTRYWLAFSWGRR